MTNKTPYELRKERSLKMAQEGIKPASDGQGIYWIPSQNVKGLKHKVEQNLTAFAYATVRTT